MWNIKEVLKIGISSFCSTIFVQHSLRNIDFSESIYWISENHDTNFDIDKYISDRGLFYPYDQLAPGPYVFNQNELLEKLLTVDQWFDVERVREYKKEFMSACDGHSTERIFHYVFCRHQENEGLVYL